MIPYLPEGVGTGNLLKAVPVFREYHRETIFNAPYERLQNLILQATV